MSQQRDALRQSFETFLREQQEHHLDLLRQMVEINSFTENPPGVNALGEFSAGCFAALGFEAEFVQSVKPYYGKHLFLTRKGSSSRSLGLISHLDTVFSVEEETQNNFHWRPAGDRIYGPGTIDIKGGTVMIYMILAAIQHVDPAMFDAITWKVMLDASEEDFAEDFGELCLQRVDQGTIACLVFEMGLVDQAQFLLVVARKGRAIFKVTAEGRASHAGSAHPHGANAITQLADVVLQIDALTNYDDDLTFCVGVIEGGTVTNRIPHEASAEVEMRAFSREVFEAGLASIMGFHGYSSVTSPDGQFPCRVKVELVRQTKPWPREASTEKLFAIWKEEGAALGLTAVEQERGGLSDANLICHRVPVMDGLGPSGGNAHCSEQSEDGSKEQEYLTVSSMLPKAVINSMSILRLICSEESGNESK